jgi:hypothetical protein
LLSSDRYTCINAAKIGRADSTYKNH